MRKKTYKQKYTINKAIVSLLLLLFSVLSYSQDDDNKSININIFDKGKTGYVETEKYTEYKMFFQKAEIDKISKDNCSGNWKIKKFRHDTSGNWIEFIKQESTNFKFENKDEFQKLCIFYINNMLEKSNPDKLKYNPKNRGLCAKFDNKSSIDKKPCYLSYETYFYGKSIKYEKAPLFKITLKEENLMGGNGVQVTADNTTKTVVVIDANKKDEPNDSNGNEDAKAQTKNTTVLEGNVTGSNQTNKDEGAVTGNNQANEEGKKKPTPITSQKPKTETKKPTNTPGTTTEVLKVENQNTPVLGLLIFLALLLPLIYLLLSRKINNLSNQQTDTPVAKAEGGLSIKDKALLTDFIKTVENMPTTAVQSQDTTLKLSKEVKDVFHYFQKHLNTIKSDINALNPNIAAVNSEITSLSSKITDNSNQSGLKLKIERKRDEIIELQNQIKSLQQENSTAKSNLFDKTMAEQNLRKEIKELESKVLQSNDSTQQTQATIAQLKTQLSESNNKIVSVKEQAQSYQDQYNQIQQNQQQQKDKRKENLLNAIEDYRVNLNNCEILNKKKRDNYLNNLEEIKERIEQEKLHIRIFDDLSYYLAMPYQLVYFCYFYGLYKELESSALRFCDAMKSYLLDYSIEIDLSLYKNKNTKISSFINVNYIDAGGYLLIEESQQEKASEIIFRQLSILALHYNNLTTNNSRINKLDEFKNLTYIDKVPNKTVMEFSKVELKIEDITIELEKYDL